MKLFMPIVARHGAWRFNAMPVEIPELSAKDAPVSVVVRSGERSASFRSYDGRLFSKASISYGYVGFEAYMQSEEHLRYKMETEGAVRAMRNPVIPFRPNDLPISRSNVLWSHIEDIQETPMGRITVEGAKNLIRVDREWYAATTGPVLIWDQVDKAIKPADRPIDMWGNLFSFGIEEVDRANEWALESRGRTVHLSIDLWDHPIEPASTIASAIEAAVCLGHRVFEDKRILSLPEKTVAAFSRAKEMLSDRGREMWGDDGPGWNYMRHQAPVLRSDAVRYLDEVQEVVDTPLRRRILEDIRIRLALSGLQPHETVVETLKGFHL